MKTKLYLFFILIFPITPALGAQQTVTFKTPDGCSIDAFYLAPSSGAYIFINTHGLGSGKYEWGTFQDELAKRGHGYLSLDMRGHGESLKCSGKSADYRAFKKSDWLAAALDIQAAAAFLKKKGFPSSRMIYCGASIGANLSVTAAAEGGLKPAAVVLLSAGADYAGVKPEAHLSRRQPFRTLLIADRQDVYAWQSMLYFIGSARRSGARLETMEGSGGHGVSMFKTPGLAEAVIGWAVGKTR